MPVISMFYGIIIFMNWNGQQNCIMMNLRLTGKSQGWTNRSTELTR